MKNKLIILIYIILLSIPCYSGVNQDYYDTVKNCKNTYDETWDKLMEILIKHDADIELISKETGLISAKISFYDETVNRFTVYDVMNFSYPKYLTGKFYFLVAREKDSVLVRILSEFCAVKEIKGIGKASSQTKNITCKSSGVFEKEIFNDLDK